MYVFEIVVALLLAGAGLTALSRRIGTPYPAALGAIVAPPDAAAATAVLEQLRPPHRLLVILEGESLFNDASALLIYRLAVGVALAGALSAAKVIPLLLVVTVGSGLLGVVLSRVIVPLIARIHDVAIAVFVQFCGTFAVWIFAERLRLSGILPWPRLSLFQLPGPTAPGSRTATWSCSPRRACLAARKRERAKALA
jgi:NhaP-type Na+/H+ or K+/H+ antiporter